MVATVSQAPEKSIAMPCSDTIQKSVALVESRKRPAHRSGDAEESDRRQRLLRARRERPRRRAASKSDEIAPSRIGSPPASGQIRISKSAGNSQRVRGLFTTWQRAAKAIGVCRGSKSAVAATTGLNPATPELRTLIGWLAGLLRAKNGQKAICASSSGLLPNCGHWSNAAVRSLPARKKMMLPSTCAQA